MVDYSPQFLACLQDTLSQECPYPHRWGDPRNFSNDPHDPGGKTMDGIIQAEYDAFRSSSGQPKRDVRQCTVDEGERIYWQNYWSPYCPFLAPGLDLSLFDSSVNEGRPEGIRILQFALGLAQDGIWGPATRVAVMRTVGTSVPVVIQKFTARRAAVYHLTRGFTRYGDDWLRRTSQMGAASLKMAA